MITTVVTLFNVKMQGHCCCRTGMMLEGPERYDDLKDHGNKTQCFLAANIPLIMYARLATDVNPTRVLYNHHAVHAYAFVHGLKA